MVLERAPSNGCHRGSQSWRNLGGYRLRQLCSEQRSGSHNGYTTTSSLSLACGFMRRFHLPRSSMTVALLGLWERRATQGSQCRALTQAAQLSFGLPTVFSAPEDCKPKLKDTSLMWFSVSSEYTLEPPPVHQSVRSTGRRSGRNGSFRCAIFGKRTLPCQIDPYSALQWTGWRLLSPDYESDIFFQNHAQMKVYGPSLAMTDEWEQRITQLGLTKTTHEYAIYQLFSLHWVGVRGTLSFQIGLPITNS